MAVSNFLSPVEFRVVINRLPNSTFFVQSANVPGVSSAEVQQDNPFKILPRPGTKVAYDDLQLSIICDEDMTAFREIRDWINGLQFPEQYPQYAAIEASEAGITSDLRLFIMDSNKNPNIELLFKNVFPTTISSILLDTKATDVVPPTFDVTFKYDLYDIIV